jgi:hypothetical protein
VAYASNQDVGRALRQGRTSHWRNSGHIEALERLGADTTEAQDFFSILDGVPLIEREQIADFFDWYRLEIEAVARSKLAAGTRGAGEHDVMVMDKDLNRPGD